jgi:MATE family, multidrug efflux pump
LTPRAKSLTRSSVLATVWPIILANASAPLLGLADTAVIGRTGSVEALGAIALGSLIFSFAYWSFGFLRMTTTGFVAQADGAGQEDELRMCVVRALLLGALLGLGLLLLQTLVAWAAFWLLDGSHEVEQQARTYFGWRIWGAPAALATYAVTGALVGLERSRLLLILQVFINGLNVVFDVYFAGVLSMGVRGIALGTVIAEWVGLLCGILMMWFVFKDRMRTELSWVRLLERDALKGLFGAQIDILVRTLFLLAGFAWFTNQGAKFGDTVLAANHVLLQLVSFSAFVLDGFAFATESLVGRAQGRKDRVQFDRAVRLTSELGLVSALILSLGAALGGAAAVDALTDLEAVRETARAYLPFASVYIALSVGAFQLDGIFIGTTRTSAMREASIASFFGLLGLSFMLTPHWENTGLWISFVGYVVLRGLTLLIQLPALRRSLR